jgi:hypothetical protein
MPPTASRWSRKNLPKAWGLKSALADQLAASLQRLAGDRPWWRSPAAGDWLRRAWASGGGWVPEPPGHASSPPGRMVYAVASR